MSTDIEKIAPEEAEQADAHEVGTEKSEASGRHRRVSRSPVFLVLVATCVLAVVAGGVLGGMAWHQHSIDQAKRSAVEAGNGVATTLLSYDHRDLTASMPHRMDLLTGEFKDRYRSMVEQSVAPAATAKQLTTTASVVGSSVVDGTGDRVTLLLFVNQSSATPTLPQPVLTGSRVELTLEEHDGRWLASDLKPV